MLQEGATRRLGLAESERDRVARSLQESQAHARELEARLASASAELSLALSSLSEAESRSAGSLPRAEADALLLRLKEAEEFASQANAQLSGLSYRATVGVRCTRQSLRSDAAIRPDMASHDGCGSYAGLGCPTYLPFRISQL